MADTPWEPVCAALPAKGPERGTVVLLHGLGADEDDLLGLGLELPRDLRYVAVRAPLAVPWGGYAWYPLDAAPSPEAGPEERAAFTAALDALTGWLRARTGAGRTVLAGFSQGAVMTAAVLCRADAPVLAGYALLSGYVHPGAPAPGDLRGRRVFSGHGVQDPVVAPALGTAARRGLQAAGAIVTHHTYGAGHTIPEAEIADLRAWLDVCLPPLPR